MITEYRFSEYRIMWLFVCFDLPVTSAKERTIYTRFRNDLLKAGFIRMQFSIYVRACMSRELANKHIKGLQKLIPAKGRIDILTITDKQYGDMLSFYGRKEHDKPEGFVQLELF